MRFDIFKKFFECINSEISLMCPRHRVTGICTVCDLVEFLLHHMKQNSFIIGIIKYYYSDGQYACNAAVGL